MHKTDETTVLDRNIAEEILNTSLARGADFAELFVERKRGLNTVMLDGKLTEYEFSEFRGVGIRVIARKAVGYAYTEVLDRDSLVKTAEAARSVATSDKVQKPVKSSRELHGGHTLRNPPWEQSVGDKVALLERAYDMAATISDVISESKISYRDSIQNIEIVNSDGLKISDQRSFLGLNVFLAGEINGQRAVARRTTGGQQDFDFLDESAPEQLARECCEALNGRLNASSSPSGEMPVVIGPGEGGVLIHEAIGHSLEGDRINKQSSFYAPLRGKQVANPAVTVYDDGTFPGRQGSYRFDDEGTPASKTTLIKSGILLGFLETRMSAHEGKRPLTGNARRQSFRFPPIPRMTCTYIQRGSTAPEDIIKSVKKGIYVATIGGGRSDVAGGNFVFTAPEVFAIRDGRIEEPVRGVTLVGKGSTILHDIHAIGNDFKLDPGGMSGHCGRAGQTVPVSFGQPTLLVSKLTVGGH